MASGGGIRGPVLPAWPIRWIAAVPAFLALTAASSGCGAPDPSAGTLEVGTAREAIYSGMVDDDGAENSGVVSLKIGNGTSFELCTGSLISPNVVLTARHCVSKPITPTVSCNERGESGNGNHVGDDEALDHLHVFTGAKPKFGGTAAAEVRAIIHPEGGVLCNSDIALLVLDRSLTGPILRVRLSASPRSGETVRAVGYGQNNDSIPVGTRLRKDSLQVLAIGQRVSSSNTPLASREFELGLSICQGDSGGPAISEQTGAVVGVVSRGGDCSDNFGHIYTTTAGFPELFSRAFEIAGGAPEAESADGTATAPQSIASPTSPHGSGCAVSPGAQDGDMLAWFAALGAAGLVRRRRERRS